MCVLMATVTERAIRCSWPMGACYRLKSRRLRLCAGLYKECVSYILAICGLYCFASSWNKLTAAISDKRGFPSIILFEFRYFPLNLNSPRERKGSLSF